MKRLSVLFALIASPALAASGPFFSLRNTDFIVTLAILLFIGILVYYRVPQIVSGLLDKRAELTFLYRLSRHLKAVTTPWCCGSGWRWKASRRTSRCTWTACP